MMKSQRKKMLIDRPVQVGLVLRLVFNWFAFLAAAVVGLPLFRAIVMGDAATPVSERATQAAIDAAVLFTLFIALLPYFILDIFRTTNRFAGPMHRLHETIRAVGTGAPFRPIKFRKGDYWHDVANDFNKMVEQLQDGRDEGVDEEVEAVEPCEV